MSATMHERVGADPMQSVEFDPFAGGTVERVAATTEAQRELWLGDQLAPEASLAFNESTVLRLQGPLDAAALAEALSSVVARHESLRATISPDGMQLLIGAPAPFALKKQDLSALAPPEQERVLAEQGEAAVLDRFALADGPLFRATLFTLSAAEHVLMMTAHHAVCDGWSWGVIVQDLGELYAEQTGAGPAPMTVQAQYSDYARREVQESDSAGMRAHEAFWQLRFKGSLPVLELPLDRPRPPVRTFASRRIDHTIDAELTQAVRKLGASLGQSLFTTLLGAFAATVHRLTEQEDLIVGVAAAGQLASGMPGLVGHCVNVLPVRLGIDGKMPFEQAARQSASALLDATEHQMAYGALLKKLAVPRDPSRLPLVNILFNLDRDAGAPQGFPGVAVTQTSLARRFENFELFLNAVAGPDGLRIETQYNSDLFDDATVRRWLILYETLLRAAVKAPAQAIGQLDMLPAAEATALHALQPAATPLHAPALMHGAFVRQAAARPARSAVSDGRSQLSYQALDEAANRLAHVLREHGVGRGARVGICIGRSVDMLVAVLATLKAGAAYVPLDPDFPQSRLDYYAEDAQLALLLTSSDVPSAPKPTAQGPAFKTIALDTDAAWRSGPGTPLAPDATRDPREDDVAYVIYTSGSTGKPKGVCVQHRAVANLLQSMATAPGVTPDDRWAAVTTLSFDIAVAELLVPLNVGAEVQIVQRDVAADGNALAEHLIHNGTTILQATPGMWRILLDAQRTLPAGLKALAGGEPVPPDLANELLAQCASVWNVYGPTETTVWSTCWKLDPAVVRQGRVSIGTPMDNTTVWIVSADGQPCAIGVPGEIWIGGTGVTHGYLERPELTAERFVIAGFDAARGQRMYRTGDRGRWRNDGLLEHMGRFDFQVKVRGYRIEPGEIEARCNEVAGVARSVVLAREDRPGDVRLVAYLARSAGAAIDFAKLDAHLRATLPKYMIPQHVVVLDALPQLPNGKVDRKRLPVPTDGAGTKPRAETVAPRNDLEREVVAVMEKVLSLPGIGVHDDFFALGGHSLLAARLTTTLGRHFGIKLPMATLFESPTPERLAQTIARVQGAGEAPAIEPIPVQPDRRSAPLTPSQERIRFIESLYPGRSVYNAPSGHRLRGPMDVAALRWALEEMVRRQPALRTHAGEDPATGEPIQVIEPEVPVALEVIDLRAVAADAREARLMALLQEAADAPFDVRRGPLFRFALYVMGEDDHAFIFVPHHLIWDGWSFDIFQAELSELYRARVAGRAPELAPLPVTQGDFAQWYRGWMRQPEFTRQLNDWKQRFAKAPVAQALPTDFPRRATMSGDGGTVWVQMDRQRSDALRKSALRQNLTLSMFCFAAYVLTVADLSPNRTLVVAMPVRGREHPELEGVMGFFNNVLPLSFSLDLSHTGAQFLAQVKAELLSVMNQQLVPFERLIEEPEFAARAQGLSLYQTLFSFQDARERPHDIGGLGHEQIHLRQRGVTDDLAMWLLDKAQGVEGPMGYNTDLYTPETAAAVRDRFLELLDRLSCEPELRLDALLDVGASTAGAHLAALKARAAAAPATGEAATVMDTRTGTGMNTDRLPAAHAPLTEAQASLAGIWAKALHMSASEIRAEDNFFDLGGDSMLAMRVVGQAEAALGFRIEARRYVFENLARLADASLGQPLAPKDKSPGLLGRLFGFGKGGA